MNTPFLTKVVAKRHKPKSFLVIFDDGLDTMLLDFEDMLPVSFNSNYCGHCRKKAKCGGKSEDLSAISVDRSESVMVNVTFSPYA